MKKSLPIFIFVLLFSLSINAQESTAFSDTYPSDGIIKTSFFEANAGLAFVPFPFPGVSYLYGTTFVNKDDVIFEYQIGLALPSLFTAKLGMGKRFDNTDVVIGIRPFQLHFYAQTSFNNNATNSWIASIEVGTQNEESLFSAAMINVGYRWKIDKD